MIYFCIRSTNGIEDNIKTKKLFSQGTIILVYFTAIFLLRHVTETFSITAGLLGKYGEKLDNKFMEAMVNVINTLFKIVIDYRNMAGGETILESPAILIAHELGTDVSGLRSLSNLGYLGNLNLS